MTSTFATPDPAALREPLLAWYAANGRHHLPWRQTRDPYAVLVSEVMLQQTQVDRVLPHYQAWLQRWPGFAQLAAASPAEVITAWRGLGYNRRARALHTTATIVVDRYRGRLPLDDPAALGRLPGLGPYTVAALRCFVLDVPVPVLDTNISRVIARSRLAVAHAASIRPAAIRAAAEALLPATGARDTNLALMDLGALRCASREPRCDACPLEGLCAWRAAGHPSQPLPAGRPAPPFASTARFARGRIVDRLRAGPAADADLIDILPPAHRERLPSYLAALERDGLIARLPGGRWSLPTAPAAAPGRS